jgi:hypothetical protein
MEYLQTKSFKNFSNYKIPLYSFLLSLLPAVLLYTYLKMNDPFHDRIKIQWGYFYFKSTLEGILFAPNSLMDLTLKFFFGKGFTTNPESIANIGFPITILLIGFLIVRLFFRKIWKLHFTGDPFLNICFWSCTLVFLYASSIMFSFFDKNSVENFLGDLIMFKSSARLSWPMWYLLLIAAIYFLEQYLSKLSFSGYTYTIVFVLLTWFVDLRFTKNSSFKDTTHANNFSKDVRSEVKTLFKNNNINVSDYQALLMLPKLMAWTDMFHSENGFWNQYVGSKISYATGLPIINATLSRMSIGETAEKIEFISHPLIEKSLHLKFPNNKKVMLVVGKNFPVLKEGEKYLISLSDTLYNEVNWTLLSLDINKLNKYPLLDSLRKNLIPKSGMPEYSYTRLTFDDQKNKEGYKNTGGFFCKEGKTEIAVFKTPNPIDSFYTFSAWTKIQWRKYGAGEFIIDTYDKDNNKLNELRLNNAVTNDISELHCRVEGKLRTCKDCSYKIYFETTAGHYVDEILFKPTNQIYHDPITRIYNGFGY